MAQRGAAPTRQPAPRRPRQPARRHCGRFTEPIAVGVLVLVAGGSAAVGAFVPGMIAVASGAFGLATTALVAYGVDRLGVLRAVERLLNVWHRR
jgi:hypothetical protein